uniref:Glycosyltransferases n=1 Tax=Leersia perrieri TaxID=77586 RepID=A0A0D9XIH6_9ORYZ
MAAPPCPPRRPISAPCFLLCFLLGFVAGLFPFAHRHLHLDLHLPLPPPSNAILATDDDEPSVVVDVDIPALLPPIPPQQRRLLLVVTPTRARPMQAYYLRRLAHTLRLAPSPLLWLVVDHSAAATRDTAELLRGCGVMYRHLSSAPSSPAVPDDTPQDPRPWRRGGRRQERPPVDADGGRARQRNAALDHIEHHRLHGIVYFADEENVYSLDLLHHLRDIRNFGTWPVATLSPGKSKTILEGPVCNGSRVVGWHTRDRSKIRRRFHVHMSGFAFNSTMLWDAKNRGHQSWNYIRQLDTAKEGFQETTFIEQLVEDETHMEGVPPGCSKIMNFHLHLEDKDDMHLNGWKTAQNLDVIIPLEKEAKHMI